MQIRSISPNIRQEKKIDNDKKKKQFYPKKYA